MSEHDVSGACPSGTVAFVPPASSPDGLDQRLQSTGGHTPGPWMISRMNAEAGFIWIGKAQSNGEIWQIAEVLWPEGDRASTEDARLIAAAPELLEALKECALQIAQNHGRRLTDEEEIALDFARAAIAKAEGR